MEEVILKNAEKNLLVPGGISVSVLLFTIPAST